MKSEDISRETVRNYLIGNLDETTVDALDELSIADQAFADRIAAEQYDLVDDWVAGELDPAERTAFGTVLARSPALVEKVKIAQMMTAAQRVAVVERYDKPGLFAGFFGGFLRPSYALGGLALLIGIAVTAYLFVQQNSVTELSEVSPRALASPSPAPSVEIPETTATPGLNDTQQKNASGENRAKPVSEPTRRPAPLFATLILSPPTRGTSSVQSVRLQPGAEFLRLTIQTEAESSGRYVVEIGEPSGKSDWLSQVVRGRSFNGRTVVSVQVPAASLKNGIRRVRLLDAAAGSEILDEHMVRIAR